MAAAMKAALFTRYLQVTKKRRAPKSDAEWFDLRPEISHMRPILGQKLKLFKVLIYGGVQHYSGGFLTGNAMQESSAEVCGTFRGLCRVLCESE